MKKPKINESDVHDWIVKNLYSDRYELLRWVGSANKKSLFKDNPMKNKEIKLKVENTNTRKS